MQAENALLQCLVKSMHRIPAKTAPERDVIIVLVKETGSATACQLTVTLCTKHGTVHKWKKCVALFTNFFSVFTVLCPDPVKTDTCLTLCVMARTFRRTRYPQLRADFQEFSSYLGTKIRSQFLKRIQHVAAERFGKSGLYLGA